MHTEYKLLINKLDEFIKRYYKNQIIRGSILSFFIWLLFYLFASVFEYFGRFSIIGRTVIFYLVLALFLTVFVTLILIPVLRFYKIGKTISHKQAAQIISKYFGDIQDKLLNTLELASIENDANISHELLIASIEQRIKNLKPVPFKAAINFKENIKYLRYPALAVVVIAAIFAFRPQVFTEASVRLVKHNDYYEPEAPFKFHLLNDSLYVQKGGDFEVKVSVEGNFVPASVSIVYGGNSFVMKKKSNSKFSYEFKNINNTLEIYFSADNIESKKYEIQVLPSPVIISFAMSIEVPAYTGETNKTLTNAGDVSVPYGSKITWNFRTKDIDSLKLTFSDSSMLFAKIDTGGFVCQKKMLASTGYQVSIRNKFFTNNDIVRYSINVVPDLYPSINVVSLKDSANYFAYYFKGSINDDYGFKKLTFNYKDGISDSIKSISLPININQSAQDFYYAFDFSTIKTGESQKIEYYFEVWDNDGINGSKSTRSTMYEFKIPSKKEVEDMKTDANDNMDKALKESMKLAKDIKKDVDALNKANINNNMSSWEKTKMLKNIADKQVKFENLMSEISNQNKMKNDLDNTFSQKQQNILDKQKQIQDLLDNVMTDELKKLLDEIKKLKDNFDPQKFDELSKNLKTSYDDLEKELDRNLQLLKQFEIEQRLQNTVDRLKDLADKQKDMSDKNEKGKPDANEMLDKQKMQEDEFKDIAKDYEESLKMNDELEKPMKMEDFKQQSDEIKDEMQKGEQNTKENKTKNAAQNQKNSSQKMKKMAGDMQKMMDANMQQQNGENYEDLRQILSNLLTFSFTQEDLMLQTKTVLASDPKYPETMDKQKDLSDNFKVIEDSLQALAKRTPEINSTVTKELRSIKEKLSVIQDNLKDRNVFNATTQQQFVMTSANNLAVLLNEALNNMQDQQQSSGKGGGKPKKPGKKKPSMSDLRSQQESLKNQLQQMLQQLKDGGGKMDKNSQNKQLSQMLAQQEMFNKMLEEMQSGQQLSPESSKKLNEIKKMVEESKNDLINKTITPNTLNRQQQIITRLLEAEKSDNEREYEKKREAHENKTIKLSNPETIFEYKKLTNRFKDAIKTSNLNFNNFYKNKYKEYLIQLTE